MAHSKKFGTFAAVFTPSVLTILGAIMYLRLGWIVGQAGLYRTLIIICVAHIISFTTGLSLSSIATDKKIQKGGIYYILSRSLGLPMGGAIGIAITLAMILNLALHIIGFSESFLAVSSIAEFFGMTPGVHAYRIIGSVVLILLVTIALISTSSALKSQFFIMAAIALSFISIILGFILKIEPAPSSPSLQPINNVEPFMYLFGIFFPATTGFTTGVAMSGDLKDPKRSIPRGVMAAIITGFVIYITLTFCFAFFVRRNLLLSDNNFLTKVAWSSPLVIAGIWGATLSTALGSILGAPRILQAIADDKIAPKFFAKCYGPNKEPRNALIFTAILAEAAVLIGDLNVIAPIAAMFFMSSYAFINLAFFLEKWSSTDFRPSFNVSRYIGLIGVIACLVVMFKLNAGAMLAAIIVMVLLYLLLKRRNINLEYGDVWQSVLLMITRNVLRKINRKKLESRNWQPNIVAFNSDDSRRQQIVDFSKWLIGQHGFLSLFDLKLSKSSAAPMPHNASDTINEKLQQTLGTKTYYCDNIFTGIENIAGTYGFIGIEPNTLLLSFDKDKLEDKPHFISMLNNISKLDKNILFMYYDEDAGFGNKKIIDIWISSGESGNLFPINLVKLLWTNEYWAESALRINVISNNNNAYSFIFNKLNNILEQMRVEGEIRIINNGIDNKSVKELIASHSFDADLILLSLPDMRNEKQDGFEKLCELCEVGKTVIFTKASNEFESYGNLDVVTRQLLPTASPDDSFQQAPIRPEAEELIKQLRESFSNASDKSIKIKMEVLLSYLTSTYDNIKSAIDINYKKVHTVADAKRHMTATVNLIKLNLKDLIDNKFADVPQLFQSMGSDLLTEFTNICANLPDPFIVLYDEDIKFVSPNDSKSLIKLKNKIEHFYNHNHTGNLYPYQGNIKRNISFESKVMFNDLLPEVYKQIKIFCIDVYYELTKVIYTLNDANLNIIKNFNSDDFEISDFISPVYSVLTESKVDTINKIAELYSRIAQIENDHIDEVIKYLNVINFNDLPINSKRLTVSNKELLEGTTEDFSVLSSTLPKIYNRLLVDTGLSYFKIKLFNATDDIMNVTKDYVNDYVLDRHNAFIEDLNNHSTIDQLDTEVISGTKPEIYSSMNEIYDKVMKTIQVFSGEIVIIGNNTLTQYEATDENTPEPFEFSVSRLLDYIYQNYYYRQVRQLISDLDQYCQRSLDKHKNILTQLSIYETHTEQVGEMVDLIKREKESIKEKLAYTDKEISSTYELTYEKLQLEAFIESSKTMRVKNIADSGVSLLNKWKNTVTNFFRNQFTQFWYKKSTSSIYAEQLTKRDNDDERLRKFMDDVASVTLKEEVDKSLPYSYKQLFFNAQHYNKELWVGKTKEINDFKILLSQYKRLHSGAIMITGMSGSGKSFFSYHVAKTLLPNAQIYSIKSVTGGSTSINKFESSFLRSTDMQNMPFAKAIEEIPAGSVLIFENIEQWWHRNEGGTRVIERIISIIDTYSKNLLFILNSNPLSFDTIRLTTDIQRIIIGSVGLSQFDAKEIETIILRRHKAGNLKLTLNNRPETTLYPWHYAKLFSTYYQLTDGNIKSALNLWISCIDKASNDTIYMHTPHFPEFIPFDTLSRQQIIFLAQFVILNNMSYERIFAISKRRMADVTKDLNTLIKLGLIEKYSENIYGINTVLYPFIVKELKRIEII